MRTHARIDLERLAANYQRIRAAVGGSVTVLPVVKADAYGHGAVEVVRTLSAAGAGWFAVSCLEEGAALRLAGIEGEILVLCGFHPGEEEDARVHRLTPMVQTAEQLDRWDGQAAASGNRLPFHLELDTGMTRLGLDAEPLQRLVDSIRKASRLRLDGLATHLASAHDFIGEQSAEQSARFLRVTTQLRELGVRPRFLHISNSAAIAYRAGEDYSMVRPGLALYGYLPGPSGEAPEPCFSVEPVLEWKARIIMVRDAAEGVRLGYDGSCTAREPMRVGVVSAGYGDGFSRRMSNGGQVLIRNRSCPVIGLVSMDVTLVDLRSVPQAEPDDEVTLIGKGLDATVMAGHCGTIPYEVLCGLSKRVPRIYGNRLAEGA